METKEIARNLNHFVNEVSLGYKGTIDLSLFSEASERLKELESEKENLIHYNADLNNQLNKAEFHIEKLKKQLSEQQPEWISVEDRLPGTRDNVLAYIVKYDLTIPSVYGNIVSVNQDDMEYESDLFGVGKLKCTGLNRTGCMFCGFGAHLEKYPNRFQRMKETHPKLWDYCIHGGEYGEDGMWKPSRTGLGMGKVLDYIGVPYE